MASRFFATISNGKIKVITDAYPPEENLLKNQIDLNEAEFNLLLSAGLDLDRAKRIIEAIEGKVATLKPEEV